MKVFWQLISYEDIQSCSVEILEGVFLQIQFLLEFLEVPV